MSVNVIHAADGSRCTDRCQVREHRAALSGQADRPRRQREEQPAVHGGGALDRAHWQSLARPARAVRQLEHGIPALSRLACSRYLQAYFDSLSDELDLEYAIVDATVPGLLAIEANVGNGHREHHRDRAAQARGRVEGDPIGNFERRKARHRFLAAIAATMWTSPP